MSATTETNAHGHWLQPSKNSDVSTAHQHPSSTRKKDNRRVSSYYIIHFFAIIASAGVMLLSFCDVYWTDEQRSGANSALKAFQFVARIHESILNLSVSAIMLGVTTRALYSGHGIPLGMVSASYQTGSVSCLLQKEFWISFAAAVSSRLVLHGSCVLVAAIFIALSGPLSAILMVPQLGWWVVDQHGALRPCSLLPPYAFASGLPETAQLQTICTQRDQLNDTDCPTGGYTDILSNAALSLRNISFSVYSASDNPKYVAPQRYLYAVSANFPPGQTMSSTQTPMTAQLGPALVDSNLTQLPPSSKYSYSVGKGKAFRKPFVEVACETTPFNAATVQLPIGTTAGQPWRTESDAQWRRARVPSSLTQSSARLWHYEWLDLSTFDPSHTPSSGALLAYTGPDLKPLLAACTIEASWVPINTFAESGDNDIHENATDLAQVYSPLSPFPRPGHIYLPLSFTNALNPVYGRRYANDTMIAPIPGDAYFGNHTFSYLTRLLQTFGTPADITSPLGISNPHPIGPMVPYANESTFINDVSATIGLYIADALARSGNSETSATAYCGRDGSFNETAYSFLGPGWTGVYLTRWRYGFGWRVRGVEVKLAIVVLSLHILVTILYLVWECCARRRDGSGSEERRNVAQLLLLAVQAEPTETLKQADVKDAGLEVWSSSTKLVVRGREELVIQDSDRNYAPNLEGQKALLLRPWRSKRNSQRR